MSRSVLVWLVAAAAAGADFVPVGVWYGGGKARAPMLEDGARGKKEEWRKDVRAIRQLGFNTIRTWVDWATGEPEAGRYHWETLDVLLELAEEEGLGVVVQVYMDSAPEWVGARHPDSLFVSANGMAIRPESSPGYCRDHPEVRRADVAFYTALAARAARSKALVGWDLWSEPHVINWANPTYIPNPEFCFCAHTQARFREWLRGKYGSLEALNRAWYRRYRSWSEVEPNRLSTILSYTDYIDWKAFIVAKLGEDLKERYDAVKRAAPRAAATSHAAGVGLFASPHYWEGQADDWVMARQVDYYGTSFYPKHSAFVDRDPAWRAALLDFTRSFGFGGGRAGFWIGELQGGFGTIGVNVSSPVTAQDLRVWTWSALGRGAKGIFYYAWYPMSTGYESGGFGLIGLDGKVTERARAAGEIARIVERSGPLWAAARPAKAEVAVLYNPLAHFVGGRQRAAAYGGPQGEVAGIERDSLLGIHRALWSAGIPVDFVHASYLDEAELGRYKLVYAPYPVMLPRAAADALKRYVAGGGTLVAEARLGWNNESGRAAEVIPGLGLDEVMGCREAAVESAAKDATIFRWTADGWPLISPGEAVRGRWFRERLEPAGPPARPVAEWDDGAAAAVESRYGRGRTLTLGTLVSAGYYSTPEPGAEKLLRGLVGWAGVEAPVRVEGDAVETLVLEAGDGGALVVLNHAQKAARTELELRGGWVVEDVLSGRAMEVASPVLKLEMPAREVRVFRWRRR